MRSQSGFWIVCALFVLVFFYVKQERSVHLVAPVFVSEPEGQKIYVELCGSCFGSVQPGVVVGTTADALNTQILQQVKTTAARRLLGHWLETHRPSSGEKISLLHGDDGKLVLECAFMSAIRRMTLAIPLHPDRMTRQDWQAVPGVGETLASRIVAASYRNGGFTSLDDLLNVRGLSAKKVDAMRCYFE